ncbi:MAG: ATP-binding cassette domain-containing protein [Casimicrobiaceae bacterium]
MSANKTPPLLAVRAITKEFAERGRLFGGGRRVHRAVIDASFEVYPGETFGLVGESGSGKTTVGRAVMMLVPPTSGQILFEGDEITQRTPAELRPIRKRMQIVFQDPYSALNPRMTVGDFVAEPLVIHNVYPNPAERQDYLATLFGQVGLDPAFATRYPHQFSGGQRQRVCIARAIALKPRFIVADEPIAALDVSIQAQIVNLFQELQETLGVAYLFISHDLRMIRHLCHRVAVIYKGRIVELGDTQEIYDNPLHPYTRMLLAAVPVPDPKVERARKRERFEGAQAFEEADSTLEAVAPNHYLAASRVRTNEKAVVRR